jgi:thioredoxin-related protein
VEQADGLAQASYYGVMSTPSIVVVDETEKEVFSWHGRMPETDEIRKWI